MSSTTTNNTTPATAWKANAERLAQWSYDRLVNRTDAYGVNKTDGTRATGHGQLDLKRLQSHSRAVRLIGVHLISLHNTCKSIKIDIDAHGDGDTAELAAKNWEIALELDRRAYELGLNPILSDSNGKGGYHLEIIFTRPIPAKDAYHFGLWLARGFNPNERGGIEVFPKRGDRDTAKGFGGGWVRLYGKHHKRDHWTRIWAEGQWSEGRDAVKALLAYSGDDPAKLAGVDYMPPPPPPASRWTPPASIGSDIIDRANSYIATIPGAVSGQHGHDATFHVACVLVEGFALSIADALPIIRGWNTTCTPPWSEAELLHKLESADAKAERRGYMLADTVVAPPTDGTNITRLVMAGTR